MSIYEDLEDKAGHDLTLVAGLHAGVSTYYCENCGALVLTRNGDIEVFHTHRGSLSEQGECHNDVPTDAKSLKEKLQEMQQRDYERLKAI